MLLCVSDGNIKSLLHKMRSCTLVRTIYKNTTIWKPIWIGFRLVPKTLWRLKASSTIISMRWFQSEILYCLQISVGCEGHSIALFLQEANKSDEATWKIGRTKISWHKDIFRMIHVDVVCTNTFIKIISNLHCPMYLLLEMKYRQFWTCSHFMIDAAPQWIRLVHFALKSANQEF